MKVIVVNQSRKRISAVWLRGCLRRILTQIRLRKVRNKTHLRRSLTVVFLPTREAQQLNFVFRKKKYPTDVLSFAYDSSDLGELVLCPEVIAQQAREHKLTFNQELTYLLVHGVLHLLGYDHEKSKREAKIMFSIQDEIFEVLR